MASILFISDNFFNESLGVMCLSSYLKANGHKVYLSLFSDRKFLKTIQDTNPDIIGFSVMTVQVYAFRSIIRTIKRYFPSKKIVWGGAHCIFMPEEAVKENIDMICIGEGEEALLTLMDRIDKREDYTDIAGLWVRKNGWIKNNVGRLEENLDKYPFPDRELYYERYPFLGSFGIKRFATQRGCPYNCSFCFEHIFKRLYKGKGRLIRRHSIGYIIEEIKRTVSKYPPRVVHFSDDVFNLDKDWVMRFLAEYRKNFKLQFTCNLCVQHLDEELVRDLSDSGCRGAFFGLESGIENTRINILNKKVSDEKFIEASSLLRSYGLLVQVNILFGLPNETMEKALESFRFLKSLKLYGLKSSVLKVYKNLSLADYLIKNGLCEEERNFTYEPKNVCKKVKNMMWAAYLFLKFPFLLRFSKSILSISNPFLIKFFIILGYWEDMIFFNLPFWHALRYFYHSRKILVEGFAKEQK